jgi:Flp pilus assembly protein TadG
VSAKTTTRPTSARPSRGPRRHSRRQEAGYVAIMVSILVPALFIGLAATAVDTAKWYLEVERVQKAADAAALAGVPYLPQDLPALAQARSRALEVARRNGFDHASAGVDVTVEPGSRPTQLRVTISSRVDNQFGSLIGVGRTTITRTAVADFTGPAPMGSPCNTFGNEPASGQGVVAAPSGNGSAAGPGGARNWSGGTGSALPALGSGLCSTEPQFWAAVEGPQTGKVQGDRYQTRACESAGVHYCSGLTNDEYDPNGYFFVVKVTEPLVGQEIRLQLYDPAFVNTPARSGNPCGQLPEYNATGMAANMNPYAGTDGQVRYGRPETQANATNRDVSRRFCAGDYFPGSGAKNQMTTTFALRQQHDSLDPTKAAIQHGTQDGVSRACVRQFTGRTYTDASNATRRPAVSQLKRDGNAEYDDQLARVFHNWVNFCSFRPDRAGDYYLQVRTNVAPTGGSPFSSTNGLPPIVYNGDPSSATAENGNTTSGGGFNAFAIRAVVAPGLEQAVSVSGYGSMPIFANAPAAQTEFYLLRVLPGAAGQFISFEFFDAADATGNGTVRVIPPADATGSIQTDPFPGRCKTRYPAVNQGWTTMATTNCSNAISNANNNGKVQEISIPIPTDYSCDYESLLGCWYRVAITFGAGSLVNDFTTWDAEIVGDPVRLIE